MVCSVDKRQQTLGRGRRVQLSYGSCAVYCTRCSFCTALLFHKMTHRTSSRLLQSGNHQLVYTYSEFWTCCLRYVLVFKLLSGGEEELKEDRRHYWMQWEVNFLRSYLKKLSFDETHWLWQTDVQSHNLSVETTVLLWMFQLPCWLSIADHNPLSFFCCYITNKLHWNLSGTKRISLGRPPFTDLMQSFFRLDVLNRRTSIIL
jgi:hypothetical protein